MDHHDSDQTPTSGFGRGWIPAERDIGLPDDHDDVLFAPATGSAAHAARHGTEEGRVTPGDAAEEQGWGAVPHSAQGAPDGAPPPAGEEWQLALPPAGSVLAAAMQRCWTPAAMVRFLDHLSVNGNVRAACARVGLSPEAAYRLRRRDAVFAAGWAGALVLARDHGEQVLATRAIDGIEEPIFHRGDLVGHRVRHDSRLLLAHLGRLDRHADDPRALAHAGRFDELLAVIGGLAPPSDLMGAEPMEYEPMEAEPIEGEPGDVPVDAAEARPHLAAAARGREEPEALLPPARAAFVAEAAAEAGRAALRLALHGEEAEDAEDAELEGGEEEDAAYLEDLALWDEERELDAQVAEAERAAGAEAAARWDLWARQSAALIDRIVAQVDTELANVEFVDAATEYTWFPHRSARRGRPGERRERDTAEAGGTHHLA